MVYGTRVYRIISFIISIPRARALPGVVFRPPAPAGCARAIPRGAAARGRSRRGRRVSVTSLRRRARGRTEVSDPRRATRPVADADRKSVGGPVRVGRGGPPAETYLVCPRGRRGACARRRAPRIESGPFSTRSYAISGFCPRAHRCPRVHNLQLPEHTLRFQGHLPALYAARSVRKVPTMPKKVPSGRSRKPTGVAQTLRGRGRRTAP